MEASLSETRNFQSVPTSGVWALFPEQNTLRLLVWLTHFLFVFFTASRHEPWADESQAWLLSRDVSLFQLIFERIRYEGTPPLWHILIMPFAKMGAPVAFLSYLGAAFSSLAIFLFLRLRNLPTYMVLMVPFSYYIAFQYAVVARSYVLVPTMLVVLLHLRTRVVEKQYIWCTVVFLMIFSSIHAAIVSLAIHGGTMLPILRQWSVLETAAKRKILIANALLGISGIFTLWIIIPPPDLDFITMPFKFEWLRVERGYFYMVQSLAGTGLATMLLLTVTGYRLWRTNLMFVFFPGLLGLCAFSGGKYFNYWHLGFPFLLWIYSVTASFTEKPNNSLRKDRFERCFTVVSFFFLTVQIGWSAQTAWYDWNQKYCSSGMVAEFLKSHGQAGRDSIGGGYIAVAVERYFDHNIFINYNAPNGGGFNWPSSFNPMMKFEPLLDTAKPRFLVIGLGKAGWFINDEDRQKREPLLISKGYHQVAFFEGNMYFRSDKADRHAFIIYERNSTGASTRNHQSLPHIVSERKVTQTHSPHQLGDGTHRRNVSRSSLQGVVQGQSHPVGTKFQYLEPGFFQLHPHGLGGVVVQMDAQPEGPTVPQDFLRQTANVRISDNKNATGLQQAKNNSQQFIGVGDVLQNVPQADQIKALRRESIGLQRSLTNVHIVSLATEFGHPAAGFNTRDLEAQSSGGNQTGTTSTTHVEKRFPCPALPADGFQRASQIARENFHTLRILGNEYGVNGITIAPNNEVGLRAWAQKVHVASPAADYLVQQLMIARCAERPFQFFSADVGRVFGRLDHFLVRSTTQRAGNIFKQIGGISHLRQSNIPRPSEATHVRQVLKSKQWCEQSPLVGLIPAVLLRENNSTAFQGAA